MKNLNRILFGPPGTGKTHRAIAEAVGICDGTLAADRVEVERRFDQLRQEGRVAVVTFHPSYSYEDFIEGLRPELLAGDGEGSQRQLGFRCVDGIFKRMCLNATKPTRRLGLAFDPGRQRVWKMSLGNTLLAEEAGQFEDAIELDEATLGYGRGLDFTGCDTVDLIREKIVTSLHGEPLKTFEVQAVDRFKNRMRDNDLIVVSDGNRRFRAIGRVKGPYAAPRAGENFQRRAVEWVQVFSVSQPSDRIMSRIFSQATIYELSREVRKDEALKSLLSEGASGQLGNHVLVIDEINRGNIAKILGELITLLEPNKRLNAAHGMRVTLPYSKDEFGVPDNLYIIGTMNTSDRSIAFLDVALRRRFKFVEVMPDLAVVRHLVGENGRIKTVDIAAILQGVNERIEALLDREHVLGHAYFLECRTLADLRVVFVEQIIPLLREYFYEDWSKICQVIGRPSASSIVQTHTLEIKGRHDEDDVDECVAYDISPAFREATEEQLVAFFHGIA